jgi:putative nucleotidyltransferase with HDIG domain
MRVSVFTSEAQCRDAIRRRLGKEFEFEFFDLDEVESVTPRPFLLFDIDFKETPRLLKLKEQLKCKPIAGKIIFAIDKDSRLQAVQAQALGATDIVFRPLEARSLATALFGHFPLLKDGPISKLPGIGAALDALHGIFSSAFIGAPVEVAAIDSAGQQIVDRIEDHGLRSWIDTVRQHHSQTYQHCLLVTGVAVAFGQYLGFSPVDRNRLSFAGMLHDIGKARVPVAILEKPTPLTDREMAVMRKHPEFGLEIIEGTSDLSPEMLDVVIHHHEYLDGSGYPRGLSGSEVSDFVRIATICDVFGALLERRAYKEPVRSDIAYQILLDMGPKLDKSLVREFKFVAALHLEESSKACRDHSAASSADADIVLTERNRFPQ